MKETYELHEVRGTKDTIDYIQFAIHFQENNEIVSIFKAGELAASLDIDTDHDIILHSALNAIGAGAIKKMRKEAEEKFASIKRWDTTHFSKKQNQVGRPYLQLAALELDVWSSIKEYFLSPDRTEKEQIYYESYMWCKTNPIMQQAMSSLSKETIDELFVKGYQLQKEANIRDVFE